MRDPAALRVHRRGHVVDDAVLAAGVHRLQTDQQGAAALGVQQFLQDAQPLTVVLDLGRRGAVRLVVAFERRIERGAFSPASPARS